MRQRVSFKKYWLIPILGAAVAIGLNNILAVLDLAKYSPKYQEAAEILYAPSFAVQLIGSGIVIPIIEEILFRGLLFRLLRKKLSFLWAGLISAALFGWYHGNLVQFVYAFLGGILLAYIYEGYKKIWAPMLAHISMNIVVCAMMEFGVFNWIFKSMASVLVVTVLCAMIATALVIRIQQWRRF